MCCVAVLFAPIACEKGEESGNGGNGGNLSAYLANLEVADAVTLYVSENKNAASEYAPHTRADGKILKSDRCHEPDLSFLEIER